MMHLKQENPLLSPPPRPSHPFSKPSRPVENCLTIRGKRICIRSFCKAEDIRRYAFDAQFSRHAQFKSLYTKKESLENQASSDNANVTLALEDENIIGFGVLGNPDEGERWLEIGSGLMMEVKAIEVCRRFRSCGIAANMMELLTHPPDVDDRIVYMVGYSWTWDLDGTSKSALGYRNILIRLFGSFGFQELQTNEPNISLKPENLFMARIGPLVSAEDQKKFKWLRFGVAP
jgi:acetoin utilization protein AcuA